MRRDTRKLIETLMTIMLWIVFITMGIVYLNEAEAEPRGDITVTLVTAHLMERDLNDVNPGVIGRLFPRDDEDLFLTAGAYYNSERRMSYLLGIGHEWQINRYLDVSVTGGMLYGYLQPTGRLRDAGTVSCEYQGRWYDDCTLQEEIWEPGWRGFILPSIKVGPAGKARDTWGSLVFTLLPAEELDGSKRLAINIGYNREWQ